MSDEIHDESFVSYSVKELLTKQTEILQDISHKVDGKADKADLAPIISEVQRAHGRLQVIEDERKSEKAVGEAKASSHRRLAWAIAAVLVPIGSTAIIVFH